jgi:tetratricopeptide (TPR) repeat protein
MDKSEAATTIRTFANMSQRNTQLIIILSLIVCTAFVYWNVDKCDFVSIDDHQYVSKNPHITSGLTVRNIAWAFTSLEAANWHPLTWMSHQLDCTLYGIRPAGHHLTNLLLHLINTVLLFVALRLLTGSMWRSAFVAALFGVHPLHVESVAWIAERKDVLSTMFMFASLIFYARYARLRKPGYYGGSLVCFALGLCAKPMIVTLPFLMMVLDVWPLRRTCFSQSRADASSMPSVKIGTLVLEKLPFLALSAASCAVTVVAQRTGEAIVKTAELPFAHRLANAATAYAAYIEKTFRPSHLAFFYPIPRHVSPAPTCIACALLLAISVCAVVLRGKRPYFLAGWLWFLGTLVPAIGIVQVGSQAMADRYSYVPIIGLFIAATWLLGDIASVGRLARTALCAVCVSLVCATALQARVECGFWKNDYTLANRALQVTKDNFLAYGIKGNFLLDSLHYDEALDCFRTSIALRPTQTSPRVNIGLILLRQGRPHEAIDAFTSVFALDSNNTLAYLDCGNAYGMIGDTKLAIKCYQRAVALDPLFSSALHNLGVTYASLGNYPECRVCLKKAAAINHQDPEIFFALGKCCLLDSVPVEAIVWLRKSIALAPRRADTYRQLAGAFEACGQKDSARVARAFADSLGPLETGKPQQ